MIRADKLISFDEPVSIRNLTLPFFPPSYHFSYRHLAENEQISRQGESIQITLHHLLSKNTNPA